MSVVDRGVIQDKANSGFGVALGKNGIKLRDRRAIGRRLVINLPVEENGIDKFIRHDVIMTDFLIVEAMTVGLWMISSKVLLSLS